MTLFNSFNSHLHHTKPTHLTSEHTGQFNFRSTTIATINYKRANSPIRVISWIQFEIKLVIRCLIIERPKPDVILVSSLSLLSIISGIIVSSVYRAKLIFEIRDIWPESIVQLGNYSPKNIFVRILKKVEITGYKYSDELVGTMPGFKSYLIKESPTFANKSHVIPQGFDHEMVRGNSKHVELIKELKKKGKFIICFAGTLTKANNPELLLDAAFKLSDESDFFFLLIGDGILKPSLLARADSLQNTLFLPSVHNSELISLLSICDVLYDGSLDLEIYQYGLSKNKWVDYMLSGRPIISSYNGLRSMINECECGIFLPVNDLEGLAYAIKHYRSIGEDELRAIGERGKTWIKEHRTFEKLSLEYEKLLY